MTIRDSYRILMHSVDFTAITARHISTTSASPTRPTRPWTADPLPLLPSSRNRRLEWITKFVNGFSKRINTFLPYLLSADVQLLPPSDVDGPQHVRHGAAAVPHAARARALPHHALQGVREVVQQARQRPPLRTDQGTIHVRLKNL